MIQQDEIDDIDGLDVTPRHVGLRVDDWLERLTALFDSIEAWAAANNWRAKRGPPISMLEPLMERYGLQPRDQPTLTLQPMNGGGVVSIQPRGLWVIGANGRVDVFSPRGAFVLIDVADQFQAPQWTLHHLGKGKGERFEPKLIADLA